jgi:hypothetical protein
MSLLRFTTLVLILISNLLFSQYPEWNYFIKYVNSSQTEVYTSPNDSSEVVGELKLGQEIIVINDTRYPEVFGWEYVIYPIKGYVFSSELVDKKEAITEKFENKEVSPVVLKKKCISNFALIKEKPNYFSTTVGYINNDDYV